MSLRLSLALALGLLPASAATPTQSITLAWDGVSQATGYIVYSGTNSFTFTRQLDVGSNCSCTLNELKAGAVIYLGVVAYDAYHNHSNPSLLAYTVPALPSSKIKSHPLCTNFSLTVSGQGKVTPDLREKTRLGENYTVTAKAAPGWVFSAWTIEGAVVATTLNYTFSMEENMQLQAQFLPNPFLASAGVYRGLFYPSSNSAAANTGGFEATVNSTGHYSARLQLGSWRPVFTGQLSPSGSAILTLLASGQPSLQVQLQLDNSNSVLTGTVSAENWSADLTAFPVLPASARGSSIIAKKYSLIINAGIENPSQPGGNSFGTVQMDAAGHVFCRGKLSDGTEFSGSSDLCSGGQWPLYISLYAGKGALAGWIFEIPSGWSGELGWFKSPENSAKAYPGGFALGVSATASATDQARDLISSVK